MAQIRRHPSYYVVGELDLRAEAERLARLPALGGPAGPLVVRPPTLTVRRASRKPRSRLGFAVPSQWRISVTAYPGARPVDLLETLVHELVHLAVGSSPESRRWHGAGFQSALRAAMFEAYGVTSVRASSTRHGAYAEAIEARRRREAA